MGSRDVICADTAKWIIWQKDIPSVITSLPDAEETIFSSDLIGWKKWFIGMVTLITTRVVSTGYSIFYQTDRRTKGGVIDKSALLHKGVEGTGIRTIFHKICLKRDPGKIELYRPAYTHLLCFSMLGSSGRATPDVFPAGRMIYKNAMGLSACKFSCKFLKEKGIESIVDPFCGQGSILAVANKLEMDAVGVDILPEQCERAKRLKII